MSCLHSSRFSHSRFLRLFFIVLGLWSTTSNVLAQDVKVRSGFIGDSLKIGEQTAFYLSARYKSDLNVLFPDSTFAFSPFEFERKQYFPTESSEGISTDSAVYYLTTFEVDRVQYLTLPVFVVNASDCTAYQSLRDSVFITQLVQQVPDSLSTEKLPLKMNAAYQNVFYQFNTWVLIILVLLLIIIAVLTWVIFGKRIRKHFRAKKLQRNHSQFVNAYNNMVAQVQSAFSDTATESAVALWKKYMEQLEARPYTKLTTRETYMLLQDENLSNNLRSIDKAIYGHDTSVINSLESLKDFADQRFSQKLQEVKHG